MGNIFGQLAMMFLPDPEDIGGVNLLLVSDLLAPAASALGVTLVGNIGKERGSIWWPLLGCYLVTPFHLYGNITYTFVTIAGIIFFHVFAKQWRRQIREPHPVCTRFLIITLCFGLYVSLWGSYAYFNLKITTKDGDRIKFRDAVGNFINSPAFQEFQNNLKFLIRHLFEHGFWSTFEQLIESLDPLGEKHALKVLGLKRGVGQDEIRAKYRELSKTWHPDRYTNEEEKIEAHEKFVSIQQAYERLSSIKRRRKSRNKMDQTEEDRTEY